MVVVMAGARRENLGQILEHADPLLQEHEYMCSLTRSRQNCMHVLPQSGQLVEHSLHKIKGCIK